MNVKVNARPKTQTAEDNRILFLVEKLEKRVDLGESDFQELFQGARRKSEIFIKSKILHNSIHGSELRVDKA